MKKLYSLIFIFGLLVMFAFLNMSNKDPAASKTPPPVAQELNQDTPKPSEPPSLSQPDLSKGKIAKDSSQEIDSAASQQKTTETTDRHLNTSSSKQEEQSETSLASVPGIYPEASVRMLTKDDLDNQSTAELKIMRNEVFARHSYIFTNQQLKKYFEEQSWHTGLNKNVYPLLSQIEKTNIALVKQQERELGKM
jgi:hypothetical protein